MSNTLKDSIILIIAILLAFIFISYDTSYEPYQNNYTHDEIIDFFLDFHGAESLDTMILEHGHIAVYNELDRFCDMASDK